MQWRWHGDGHFCTSLQGGVHLVIHHDASVSHFAGRFSRALQIAEKPGRVPL